MKKLMAIIILISASAMGQESTEPRLLGAAQESAVRAYGGTAAPSLPDDGLRGKIVRPQSSVPGRLLMIRSIAVHKDRRQLYLKNGVGDTLMRFPVCSSRNRGQKTKKDDWRTPEGTFPLYGIYNSTDWTFEDTGSKCYGPIFLSIKTPRYWGIGIHGTNAPSSVPGRSSHGCMRLHNENVVRLKPLVQKDLYVTVLPDDMEGEP